MDCNQVYSQTGNGSHAVAYGIGNIIKLRFRNTFLPMFLQVMDGFSCLRCNTAPFLPYNKKPDLPVRLPVLSFCRKNPHPVPQSVGHQLCRLLLFSSIHDLPSSIHLQEAVAAQSRRFPISDILYHFHGHSDTLFSLFYSIPFLLLRSFLKPLVPAPCPAKKLPLFISYFPHKKNTARGLCLYLPA